MNFVTSSSTLLHHLQSISGALSTNTKLPILDNFLFKVREQELTVIATDLETTMITHLEVQAEGDGDIAIPAKLLLEVLKNLPEQPCSFRVNLELFEDRERGGLWATSDQTLLARMKDDYDGAEPSGNATAALALAELGRLTDDPRWIDASRRILDWLGERMRRLPQAVPHALLGLQRYHEPPARLVLAGPWPSQDLERLRRAAGSVYRPDVLITRADGKHPSEFVRSLVGQAKSATAFLCEGNACRPPIVQSEDLIRELKGGV